jgi:hypothetical protein
MVASPDYLSIIVASGRKMASIIYEIVEKVIFYWLFKNAQMQGPRNTEE